MRPEKLNRAHGTPAIADPELAKRLLGNVEVLGEDTQSACWIWKGFSDRKGYGKVKYKGRSWWVHRLAYAVFVGDIPEEYHVHHNCHTKDCINPKHLEAVTPSENTRERIERYGSS